MREREQVLSGFPSDLYTEAAWCSVEPMTKKAFLDEVVLHSQPGLSQSSEAHM